MKRLIPYLIAFAAAAALYLSGATNQLERDLMDGRFVMLQRHATGSLVVVGIDPKSLRELNSWPWPRTLHAQMIHRLVAAGARSIALDIDFSSRSTPAADAALGKAIAWAGHRIILPQFRQRSTIQPEPGETLDITRPFPTIGRTARLASVTVRPSPDGLVRRALVGERVNGRLYPSFAAALAGVKPGAGPFYIDYGILADSLPVLSYADVLAGRFNPDAFAGKSVIVGATAVELGDRLSVPLYRSLPGPVVQALAYESLVQHRAIHQVPRWIVLAVALLLAISLGPLFARWSWRWSAATVLAVSAIAFVAAIVVQARWPLTVAITPWILTVLFCFSATVIGEVEHQARMLFLQGMEVLSKGAMLRGVVEDSFDGIAITDERGVIEIFNHSAAHMLGRPSEEAVGTRIAALLPLPPELAAALDNAARVPDRFATPCEIELASHDGSPFPVELVVSTSNVRSLRTRRRGTSDRRQVLIFTFHDVRERRQALAAQVAATEEAMAASRAKSEFLTNMSHELRTPLNAIIGFSEMLCEQVFGPLGDSHYLAYAKDIFDSGSHLRDLVNDILDVSKIEAGKLELNEDILDVAQLADGCVRMVGSRANERSIRLGLDAPPDGTRLMGDERLVKQSLLNLLSNALKFTPEGGSVDVKIVRENEGDLVVRVRDTGIGIPAEHLPRLGQPFYQVDGSLARTHEGTGLGLYLVSKFMALHDGAVGVESEPGKGTEVTLRFPAERAVKSPQAAAMA